MNLLPLLGPLLTLADNLKSLRDISREHELDRFDRLIQPIHDDMQVIHHDYLEILTRVKQTLESTEDLDKAIQAFEMDRVKLAATRTSCIELARELSKDDRLKKYKGFFESITNYFFLHEYIRASSTPSAVFLGELVDRRTKSQFGSGEQFRMSIEIIRDDLENHIRSLNENWSQVNVEYAKLLGKTF